MRALKLTGAKQLELAETDKPQLDLGKILIEVERCGICGSDLHIWQNGMPVGLIMGHEFAGTVADPGEAKDIFQSGDRVTALPVNPCGICPACKNLQLNKCTNILADAPGITTAGAYAQYLQITAAMVRTIPASMSMEEAAMAEPSAVALHAVNLAGVAAGDKVLIVGGGIIGLLCAAWARISGPSFIGLSEANAKRGKKALGFGDVDEVFDAIDPQLQKKLLTRSGGGFNKVIECAGPAPAVKSAIGAAASGGIVVLAGINYHEVPVSTMRMAMKELQLKGSYGYNADEFDMAIDYIARRILKTSRFVDHTVSLEGVQDAFIKLTDPAGDAVKIMMKP
jgi:2-desacetyl-2-hydroxyethyl bacteriochlorophyllide A dehydrogenase